MIIMIKLDSLVKFGPEAAHSIRLNVTQAGPCVRAQLSRLPLLPGPGQQPGPGRSSLMHLSVVVFNIASRPSMRECRLRLEAATTAAVSASHDGAES